jgi:Right handed beta helix region
MREQGCEPIYWRGGSLHIGQYVTGSGRTCLIHDLTQRRGFTLSESLTHVVTSPRWSEGVLRFLQAENLTIDMRGHLVSTDPFKDLTGVVSSGATDEAGRVRHVVRNGVVVTSGPKSIGVFMVEPLLSRWADPKTMAFPKGHDTENEPFDFAQKFKFGAKTKTVNGYPERAQYVVESMKIYSQGRAVVMAGVGNELRDSEIHVDGDTAVTLYGPGTVVEGNTFYVYLSKETMSSPDRLPAILKLRDAHGAVIRNNRFIVKSVLPFSGQVAINLLESTDVVIEGNELVGVQQLVRKDAMSSTVERDNRSK